MKHTFKRVSLAAALLSCSAMVADSCSTTSSRVGGPFLYTRSQSVNLARQNAGLHDKINLCDQECLYGVFAMTFEYQQSFKSSKLAQQLLGSADLNPSTATTGSCNSDCGNTLRVQGSSVANRLSNAWMAENFGLGELADTSITLKPRSRAFLFDFDLYLGLDEWCNGLYFRAYAPVVNVRNELRACETVNTEDTTLPGGYFNGVVDATPAIVPVTGLGTKATDYLSGNSAPAITGITWDKLKYSKWAACKTSKTGLADLRLELGYNFWCCEDYHLGVGFLVAAPTGNRAKGCNFFEPIVGNGKHWEVGGTIHSHATLWRCEESDSYLNLELDANITTLLASKQTRTFDLKNKPNSRYMVAAEHVAVAGGNADPNPAAGTATQLVSNVPVVAPFKFNNHYAAVANLTTQDVDVKIGVQADFVAKLVYSYCNWDFGLGYNLWTTSCEKFKDRKNCASNLNGFWALKGTAYAYGFGNDVAGAGAVRNTPVALAFSDSKADIHNGTNLLAPVAGVAAADSTNAKIDAVVTLAFNLAGAVGDTVTNDLVPTAQTNFSKDPVFIKSTDIDRQGNKTFSNKVFGHIDYSWPAEDEDCWGFFVGVGGEGEFGNSSSKKACNDSSSSSSSSCNTSCGTCRRSTLSQWGVWIKGGVTF